MIGRELEMELAILHQKGFLEGQFVAVDQMLKERGKEPLSKAERAAVLMAIEKDPGL